MANLPSIMDLGRGALQAELVSWGQPKFRAAQVWQWLYVHLVSEFAQMTNLPKTLRERLEQSYRLDPLTPVEEQVSKDHLTRKMLFGLVDGSTVESVLMYYDMRHSVCVSTQVGCPVGCTFCATGQSGFVRNLTVAEIAAQPLYFARQLQARNQSVSNIVVMGMGEPLLNYEATWQAVETWNDHEGFNLGARKIILSTAGYIPGIERLSQESLQVGLAVSLHATDDLLRSSLVPLNKTFGLRDLMTACRIYTEKTGRRITFEYALIDGVNDAPAQAERLALMVRGMLAHINLIPLNPSQDSTFKGSSYHAVRDFQHALQDKGASVTVRLPRGGDIQAGCGQLRQRHNNP